MKTIYLDYNASTPVVAEVVEAMVPFFSRHFGNPSSDHPLGRAASEAIEDARMHVASLIGADRDEIFFTSGGTESNNLALLGSLLDGAGRVRGHVITTQIEHPAVTEPLRYLESLGLQVTRLPSNSHGLIDPDDVKKALRSDTRLVSVMHANNETGVIQPLPEIGSLLQDHDIVFHTDAAQSLGKISVQVDELGTHLLAIAGHKCYAPKGIGALYVRFGTPLHAIMRGASHERGLRPGTENVPGIVGLGRACQWIAKQATTANAQTQLLRDQLSAELVTQIPGLQVHGALAPRLPNTLSVAFPRVSGHELLQRAFTVLASTGSACHSGLGTRSATLENLGLDLETARGTIRLSLGWPSTAEEIQQAGSDLIHAWQSLV